MVADPRPRQAVATGSEVPGGDFRFRVHSVFAASLNLVVSGQRGLVSLTGADGAERPRSIRLATNERFDAWPVTVGMDGRREGARLVFGGNGLEGETFAIDLDRAVAAGRRRLARVDGGRPAVRATWSACAARLGDLQAERGAELRLTAVLDGATAPTPTGRRLADAARALGDAARALDVAAADAAAAALVGLGPGLTPAGDDYLCGFLAALRCTSRAGDTGRRFTLAWGRRLLERLPATTVVSATYLESALAGAFAGEIHALVGALAAADADTPAALEALCATGHSSGMDTATGLLHGLWLRSGEEARHHAP